MQFQNVKERAGTWSAKRTHFDASSAVLPLHLIGHTYFGGTTMSVARTLTLSLVVAVVSVSCGGGGGYGGGATTPTPTPTPGGTGSGSVVTVTIRGVNGAQSFTPNPASCATGQTVVFYNADSRHAPSRARRPVRGHRAHSARRVVCAAAARRSQQVVPLLAAPEHGGKSQQRLHAGPAAVHWLLRVSAGGKGPLLIGLPASFRATGRAHGCDLDSSSFDALTRPGHDAFRCVSGSPSFLLSSFPP